MGFGPNSIKASKKREMEDTDQVTDDYTSQYPFSQQLTPRHPEDDTTDPAPRILARHHHRRRNIAIDTWGPEFLVSMRESLPNNEPEGQPFNVYKCILRHKDVFLPFVVLLPFASFMSLYAIDKEFHWRINKNFISTMKKYALYHAPIACNIFGWALYPWLTISDPMLKPMDSRSWLARDVPGFRWLGMILWRQSIIRSILSILSMEGHRVPAACEPMLMKYWCLMETTTKRERLAYLRDKTIWTDSDIIHFHLFLMKLDIRFTDPILGSGAAGLSQLLLSQKSLSTLWEVLSGKLRFEYDDLLKMVRGTFSPEDLDTDNVPWLLDPIHNPTEPPINGVLSMEHWAANSARLPYACFMVINEGIKRQLHVQKYFVDFVLYGWMDEMTGKNIPLPRHLRADKCVNVPREGWPEERVRRRLIKELDHRFGVSRTEEQRATYQST